MTNRKRHLHQSKHPFAPYPFEAVIFGSWQAVEFIKIKSGTLSLHTINNHHMVMEKGPFSDIRIRSRKATLSDCSCVLRPGIDICVLSAPQQTNNSDKLSLKPVWADARISSIQRKPHDSECSCQFYVNFYVNQGSLGAEVRSVSKEVKVFGINQISILQRLEHNPCEDQHYRWASSEDCSVIPHTKLLLGKFLSDISWLVVTSILKKVSFCARSINNKLVYQILGSEHVSSSLKSEFQINVVNFRVDNGMLVPTVSQVTPNTKRVEFAHESLEDEASPSYNVGGLRRSKRRNVQPERYLCCKDVTEFDVGSFRTAPPIKIDKGKDNELSLPLPLSRLFGLQQKPPEEDVNNRRKFNKMNTNQELLVYNRRGAKTKKVKLGGTDQIEHENQLAIIPLPDQEPIAIEHCDFNDKFTRSHGHQSSETSFEYYHLTSSPKPKRKSVDLLTFEPYNLPAKSYDAKKSDGFSSGFNYGHGTPKLQRKSLCDLDDMDLGGTKWEGINSNKGVQKEKYRPTYSRSRNSEGERTYRDRTLNAAAYKELINSYLQNINTRSTKEEPPVTDQWKQFQSTSCFSQKREIEISHGGDEEEDSEMEMLWREMEVCLASIYLEDTEGSNAANHAKTPEKSKEACQHEERLDEQIGIYCIRCGTVMVEIKHVMPPFIEHLVWRHEEKRCSGEHSNSESKPDEYDDFHLSHGGDEEEDSEMEMLWREMEVCLASIYLEDTEGSNAANHAKTLEKSKEACQHEERLDEQIGIYCIRCGTVMVEIKHVMPPFIEHLVWRHEEKQCSGEHSNSESKPDEDDELATEENNTVWALIPELRKKLHAHQRKAFEFLWQNIAGSMEPALMETKTKKRGGCVISHSPGAGKTFLMITFLVSYLKLFPGKRPLVLAPKTTLYTWYKEFIKWEIPIPVYLIHGHRTYRVFNQKNSVVFPGIPKPTEDVKHVLDCLEKIKKWHSQPSVLIMGYTSFLTLMRENSKFAHRKYMAKVLRESPGILVLDEGHNPRSTKSRLRKVLMKVQTKLRILLSGTLFQNNFCEYFNTLCLARPKFAQEVLKALDPKYKRKKKRAGKAQNFESRARKFFLDTIAKKIDSNNGEERMQGLNMLRNVTNGFIDVYEGGSSDGLPGLQIYTLLMNPTEIQHEILHNLHKRMAKCNGYPLELELLITLGSIHPWLVKTVVCAEKFFTKEELEELEKYKFDLKIGSKIRFVLSLIYRVVKNEKVLIFCHNIAPMKLLLEYFERYFKWQKGREVLVLTGELELFERGRVMDKFEEPGGASKILLASITACAEGISLTAASRVIMLDSEWNPSKTKQAIARAFRPGQQRMVFVYQLLVTGSLEEDKYRRTTWKEWVSSMIFSEEFVEDPSQWQAQKIEDDILHEMVEEDRSKSFHMIMKNEKASTKVAQ